MLANVLLDSAHADEQMFFWQRDQVPRRPATTGRAARGGGAAELQGARRYPGWAAAGFGEGVASSSSGKLTSKPAPDGPRNAVLGDAGETSVMVQHKGSGRRFGSPQPGLERQQHQQQPKLGALLLGEQHEGGAVQYQGGAVAEGLA